MSWKELPQPGWKQEVLEGLRGCEKFWRLRSQNKTLFWYGAAHSSISTLCTHEWVKPYKTTAGKWHPPFYKWWNGSTEGAEARFQTWIPPDRLLNPKQGNEINTQSLLHSYLLRWYERNSSVLSAVQTQSPCWAAYFWKLWPGLLDTSCADSGDKQ